MNPKHFIMSEISKLPNTEGAEELNKPDNESINEKVIDGSISEIKDSQDHVKPVAEAILTSEDQKGATNDEVSDSEAGLHEDDKVIHEIDESNAKDAEDADNKAHDNMAKKEYNNMSLEALTIELENLIKTEKIQTIRSLVSQINNTFKTKYQNLIEEKKEEFLNEGGNEIDFYYTTPIQKRFKNAYNAYRTKRNEHRKSLEQNLKQNLVQKLEIIEELKGLINVEENINTTYKHFKELQERWRNTGPIPRDKYNNAWNSYHHHVEIFYDFLHLNRDLRDLDFKHNLEKKLLIIERAEALAQDDDVIRSFRELQELHKMWKEELGPVAKEHREEIWDRFKNATKVINDKRQLYYKELDKVHEQNLEKKLEIIAEINAINAQKINSHSDWQKRIKAIEVLRSQFFNAGKVPLKVNEETWAKFKEAVRAFNRAKNTFYKSLKKEQYVNLQKKLELIKIAEDNKESDDFEVITPLMKKIQSDWKKIGHVPRKDSDKIWKQFKDACNYYFNRIYSKRNAANNESLEALSKKNSLLDTLKTFKPSNNKEESIETIKNYINQWKALGSVPNDKRFIESKFQKIIDSLLSRLNMEKNDIEMIKFESKLSHLSSDNNNNYLNNERTFIRKKIDELKSEINQLENNLQFFTNVNDDNPLVKEVRNNIKAHKDALDLWKNKLQKIKQFY